MLPEKKRPSGLWGLYIDINVMDKQESKRTEVKD